MSAGVRGSSGGQVHDAIAVRNLRRNARTAAVAHRRRIIAQAERARERAIADLEGNLHALLMVDRFAAFWID